jgi:hypothetical protein
VNEQLHLKREFPKRKKSRRFYLAFVVIILLLAVTLSLIIGTYYANQNNFGPGPIDLEVKPDKPYFLRNEQANFTFLLINNQSWPVTKPLLQETNITKDGILLENTDLHTNFADVPTIPANSSTQLYWTWRGPQRDNQTLTHEAGNYTLTVRLEGFGYDVTSGCIFEIK